MNCMQSFDEAVAHASERTRIGRTDEKKRGVNRDAAAIHMSGRRIQGWRTLWRGWAIAQLEQLGLALNSKLAMWTAGNCFFVSQFGLPINFN